MPDPVTTNLQLAIPSRGADSGTWDTPVNGDMSILDSAFGGVTSISVSSSPVSLSVSQAQAAILSISGSLTSNVTITLPAIAKSWTVDCYYTGNFAVILSTGVGGGQVIGLPSGAPIDVYSDGTNVFYKNLGCTGDEKFWCCTDLPLWVKACTVYPWLIMDGSAFNATTYARLNTFLGGNTLVDARGRPPYALDNQGGTAANRITDAGSGIVGTSLGASGGAQNVTLTQGNLPSYSPAVTDPGHAHVVNVDRVVIHDGTGGPTTVITDVRVAGTATDGSTLSASTGISVASGGSGNAVNKMPPTLIAGIFVIKT